MGSMEDDLDWGSAEPIDPAGIDDAVHPNAEAIRETPKALLVRVSGKERWVPKGQIHADSEVYALGHKGRLVITAWLAKRWNDEGEARPARKAEEAASFPDSVCLRETAKALVVRIGAEGDEVMIPKSQVLEDSEVQGDGDLGELRITAWIAKQKNLM